MRHRVTVIGLVLWLGVALALAFANAHDQVLTAAASAVALVVGYRLGKTLWGE